MYIRNSTGHCGGSPNVYHGSPDAGVEKYNTGNIYSNTNRKGSVTRGKSKGVKYIIKVL